MDPSDDFVLFVQSMDDPVAKAYDLDALGRLEGDELSAAKYALAKNLERHVDDPRTPDAIRMAGFAELVPKLREAVGALRDGVTRAAAAEALWALGDDPRAIDALAEVFAESADPAVQIRALRATSRLEGEGVDRRLAERMALDDKAIRQAADTMLWDRHGVGSVKDHPPEELADAARHLTSKDPETRRRAVADFRAAARKLGPAIRGRTSTGPKEVPAGASEALTAFLKSMGDASSRAAMERYDLAALGELRGGELERAKQALAANLESRVDDPRTPDAIRMMHFDDLVPQLRGAVAYYPNNYTRAAAAEALWELTRAPDAIDALVEVSAKGREPEIRILATDALSRLAGEGVDDLLAEVMVSDTDRVVRVAAESMLWDRNGVSALRPDPPAELADAARRLKSQRADVRREAVTDFRDAATRARAGDPG